VTYSVRPAQLDDLEVLVTFTLAEAVEAEGIQLLQELVKRGVRTGLAKPALATFWVLESSESGTHIRLWS
jgi:hypothetical protein